MAVALFAGLAATLSGGPLADGRMATLGPSGWRTAVAALVLLGVSAGVVVLTPPSVVAVRRLSLRRALDAVAERLPRRRIETGPEIALPVFEPSEPDDHAGQIEEESSTRTSSSSEEQQAEEQQAEEQQADLPEPE